MFIAILFCGTAVAQEIEISGTVTTSTGETLPGPEFDTGTPWKILQIK